MNQGKLSCWMLAGIATCGALQSTDIVHADVSWEHSGTVRVGAQKQPTVRFKMYNNWTAQRHRLLMKYSVHNVSGLRGIANPLFLAGMSTLNTTSPLNAFAPTQLSYTKAPAIWNALGSSLPSQMRGGMKNYGAFGIVHRIDDDRLIAYESQSGHYISQPRRAFFERLRFDPYKTLAPELSRTEPLRLSPEQRARLVQEVGAIAAPLQKKVVRTYFRPLSEERTFRDIPGQGYRMTQLINTGTYSGKPQWMRMNFEWWVADTQDVELVQFRDAARENLKGVAWPTTSMWINEALSLGRYSSDPQWRQAMKTFAINDAPNASLLDTTIGVTPLYLAITVIPPTQFKKQGDFRMEINLTQRSTDTLPQSVFAQPNDYKAFDLEPLLKQADPILDGSWYKTMVESML